MSITIAKDDDGRLVITCGGETFTVGYDDIPVPQSELTIRERFVPGIAVANIVKLPGDKIAIERIEPTHNVIGHLDNSGHLYLYPDVPWPDAIDVGNLGNAVSSELGIHPEIVINLRHRIE